MLLLKNRKTGVWYSAPKTTERISNKMKRNWKNCVCGIRMLPVDKSGDDGKDALLDMVKNVCDRFEGENIDINCVSVYVGYSDSINLPPEEASIGINAAFNKYESICDVLASWYISHISAYAPVRYVGVSAEHVSPPVAGTVFQAKNSYIA